MNMDAAATSTLSFEGNVLFSPGIQTHLTWNRSCSRNSPYYQSTKEQTHSAHPRWNAYSTQLSEHQLTLEQTHTAVAGEKTCCIEGSSIFPFSLGFYDGSKRERFGEDCLQKMKVGRTALQGTIFTLLPKLENRVGTGNGRRHSHQRKAKHIPVDWMICLGQVFK